MRSFLIVRDEGKVCVDSAVADVDCTTLPDNISYVIWQGWIGRIQYEPGLHTVFYDPTPYAYLIDQFIANAPLTIEQAKTVKNDFMDAIVGGRRIMPWFQSVTAGNFYWDASNPAMIMMAAALVSARFMNLILIDNPAITSWTVPGDALANSIGSVEGIGSGQNGSQTRGGGGGAWGRKRLAANTFSAGNVFSLHIGTVASPDTWFINTSTFLVKGGSASAGGLASGCIADLAYGGGDGGPGQAGWWSGGGGAGGPSSVGVSGTGSSLGGSGGAGNGGYGGAGGDQAQPPSYVADPGVRGPGPLSSGGGGGPGLPPTDQIVGTAGGAGGKYGGGGGSGAGAPSSGAQGALLISYLAVRPVTYPWLPLNASAPVNVSGTELSSIVGGILDRRNRLQFACATKKEQVNALTTIAQVVGYDATTGWP